MIKCISLVEMHHLELLSKIIRLLGVDPGTGIFKTAGPFTGMPRMFKQMIFIQKTGDCSPAL